MSVDLTSIKLADLQHLVGIQDLPYEVDIERGKIREFARAVYSNHPAFVLGKNPIVPPTFLTVGEYVWGHWLENPENTILNQIPFDLFRTFDGEEQFIYHDTPPAAGDTFLVYKTLERIYEKHSEHSGRMIFIQFLSQFKNVKGKIVAEMRSTWIKTEITSDQESTLPPTQIPPSRPLPRYRSPFSHIKGAAWNKLEEGDGPGPVRMAPLTLGEIVRYEGAISGFGPVHFDVESAKTWGYSNVYSTGLLHAGALGTYITYWLGPENIRSFKSRFVNVIWLGDEIIYEAKIKRKYMENNERKADVNMWCSRSNGELLVTAEATFVFP